jgi:hypothetical protein
MLARRGENVCTDPSLLDVAGALATLPELSLQDVAQAEAVVGKLHPHLMHARRDRVRAFDKVVVDPKKRLQQYLDLPPLA